MRLAWRNESTWPCAERLAFRTAAHLLEIEEAGVVMGVVPSDNFPGTEVVETHDAKVRHKFYTSQELAGLTGPCVVQVIAPDDAVLVFQVYTTAVGFKYTA